MRYRRLGRTGLDVSEIGLGALEIGRDWGIRIEGDFGRPDERAAIRLVHAALHRGINFFDTAPAYQLSEERLGKALAGHRNNVYIATKVGEHHDDQRGFWYDYSRAAVRASVEQSLRRLQTDVIDLFQIHSASIEIISGGEVLDEMVKLRDAGMVRFLGMSGGHEAARAAIENGGFDTVQVDYNLINRRAREIVFPAAEENDIGVIIMAPLAHGALTDKSAHLDPDSDQAARVKSLQFLARPDQTLADAAIRFVLGAPAVSTVIAGTRKIENLDANLNAAGGSLHREEWSRLE